MIQTKSNQTVELIDAMGSDAMFVAAARVSFAFDPEIKDELPEGDQKLLHFLMRNRHLSCFEHGAMTFAIETTIEVARELLRHRTFSFNEFSLRYAEAPDVFYLPDEERPLIQQGKPGHYIFVPGSQEQWTQTCELLADSYNHSYNIYRQIIGLGVAKEVARKALPLGMYTKMYITAKPRNLLQFLSLRTINEDATYPSYPMHEIREVADQIEVFFKEQFPITWSAWNQYGRVGL